MNLNQFHRFSVESANWLARLYAPPSPWFIKAMILQRYAQPDTIWIETGTHMAETTMFLRSISSRGVVTIEPYEPSYRRAAELLEGMEDVKVLHGTSEQMLPIVLPQLTGNISFWLDGHYSGEGTFQGGLDTPIVLELEEIQSHITALGTLSILIDDVRCFTEGHPEHTTAYPNIDYLVNYARKNRLLWCIEQDIFIMQTRSA